MARQFTQEELNEIISDYNNGSKPIELGKKYKRNPSSIINKLKSIGVFKNSRTRFTDEDIEFLRETYPKGDWDAIKKRFPKSNRQSIITFACKNNIHADYYFWDKDDLDFLEKHYYDYSIDELYNIFSGRYTKDAIQSRALKKV